MSLGESFLTALLIIFCLSVVTAIIKLLIVLPPPFDAVLAAVLVVGCLTLAIYLLSNVGKDRG